MWRTESEADIGTDYVEFYEVLWKSASKGSSQVIQICLALFENPASASRLVQHIGYVNW
jgi:hypothetical protein